MSHRQKAFEGNAQHTCNDRNLKISLLVGNSSPESTCSFVKDTCARDYKNLSTINHQVSAKHLNQWLAKFLLRSHPVAPTRRTEDSDANTRPRLS
ncbi:hypothetical protein EVAR_72923_1 [Eumeta japonica]|uniref:Uncharacterized protein n=1 Tax=Eumeta variegata TaxID=151549 RepID=A0A4C1TCM0_EUMVA|nr:hypothetical protein EVAR_72923_1 [Eumeta japonica]